MPSMPILTEEAVTPRSTKGCICVACEAKKGRTHIVGRTVHGYTTRPSGGWRCKRTTMEQRAVAAGLPKVPTFGVELETDVAERPSNYYYMTYADQRAWHNGVLNAEQAADVALPARGFWHPKHDGTVSGPEFASQPATLAYWRELRPKLEEMFKALLHGGVRSHDGGHAGMHVNIGTDAFSSAEHLERFMALVVADLDWTKRMAQRTSFQWCSPSEIETAHARRSLSQSVFTRGQGYTGHTCMVNVSHPGRIEFRAPRGTLRIDRFFAKLEWVAAMVEFTRDLGNSITVDEFTGWVATHETDFPELMTYFRERFSKRLERVAGL